MMNCSSISENYLPIERIEKIVKGFGAVGRIVPSFSERPHDMLGYIISGDADYFYSNGVKVSVHPGTLLYIPKGGNYYYDIYSHYEYIYIDFDFLNTGYPDTAGRAFALGTGAARVYSIFSQLNTLWLTKPDGYHFECVALIYSALSIACRTERKERHIPGKTRELADKCATILQEKCSDDTYRICDLANELDVSQTQLRRVFLQVFGVSPIEYFTSLRLDSAKALLTDTGLKISTIAAMCGFSDSYYFSRVFSKKTGCSPTVFRNSADKNDTIKEIDYD